MRDEPPDLAVYDVGFENVALDGGALGEDVSARRSGLGNLPRSGSDTVEFGGASRFSGMLVLGVAGIAAVASIVLVAHRSGDAPTARPASQAIGNLLPWPTPAVPASVVPAPPTSALVEGELTCFETGPGHGGTISLGIRNRLSHAVVVQRVSFAPQPGVGIAATSIGINHRSPSICPAAADLHPAARYRLAPGPVWISVRLTSTPACGTELRARWVISFSDRGRTHRVSFGGDGIATNCPPRVHFSHGRYG